MRIVLQQVKTLLYLQSPGAWTRSLAQALDFGSSHRAIQFARRQGLTEVQVVAVFISGAYVETVALQTPLSTRPQVPVPTGP